MTPDEREAADAGVEINRTEELQAENAALIEALKKAKDVLEHLPLTGDVVHAICMADAALAKVLA